MHSTICPLCHTTSTETVLWQDQQLRVVYVDHPSFPGFCRVIWHTHIAEMSDLSRLQQQHLMNIVFTTEHVLRELINPDKINLASLGNLVPHLHWHIIPRFTWDSHFPEAIWSDSKREIDTQRLEQLKLRLHALPKALHSALTATHQSIKHIKQ